MIASRKILLRWLSWYGFINGLISAVIGIRYLFFYSFPTELSAISYVPLALITHFISLNYLPMVLLMMPIAILIPNKRFIFCLSIILMASINTLLIFDTNFFAENKYHLSLLTSVLFDQRTYMLLALQFLIVLIFEFVLAQQLFTRINNPDKSQLKGKPLVYVFLVSWIYVQGLHIWADATYNNAVTGFTRYLPLYRPVHAKRDLARLGLIDSERLRNERSIEKLGDFYSEQLNYPINPLSCQQRDREVKNIIVLLIDALRPEMVSNRITPAIDEWRTQALQFENHFSGGTSSRMGTFSLLYGIPTTYWRTYHDNQRASILIDQLTSYNYDVVAISSGGFGSPTLLDRTAFSQIKNLNVKKLSPSVKESNRMVTDKWMSWLSNYDRETPFFAYLHYDPPMNSIENFDVDLIPSQFLKAKEENHLQEVGRYTESIHLVDQQVEAIHESLIETGLIDNTVIIITSDHGYELNDYGTGYYGHSSNYSPAQMKVPFFLSWPGKESSKISKMTSHNDLVPTLLSEILGCINPTSDYSSGFNLFGDQSWEYLVAGSYDSYAIVSEKKTIVSYGGYFEVLDKNYNLIRSDDLDKSLIESAMKEMKRFYR